MSTSPVVRASIAALLLVSLAAPAIAKTSIQQASNLCKAAVKEKSGKSVKVFDDNTKVDAGQVVLEVRYVAADGQKVMAKCVVDREAGKVASLEPQA